LIGGLAAGAVLLAYAVALANYEARARAEELFRAEVDAQYDTFCARFARSAAPDDRARCVTALRALRAWEDEERPRDGVYF
jgi:hypothetical protein